MTRPRAETPLAKPAGFGHPSGCSVFSMAPSEYKPPSRRPRLDQLPRADEFLHPGRAFVDAQSANLAIEALDNFAASDPAATEHLQRPIDNALSSLRCGHLRHGGLDYRRQFLDVPAPRGAIGQQRSRIDLRRHLAKRGLSKLEVSERRAKHFSALCMRKRLVEGAPSEAERRGRDGGAENVERAHGDLEALSGGAEPPVRREVAAFELERGQRMRGHDVDAFGD